MKLLCVRLRASVTGISGIRERFEGPTVSSEGTLLPSKVGETGQELRMTKGRGHAECESYKISVTTQTTS